MKTRIIIASVIVLVLSLLVIITLQKSDGKPEEPFTTNITTNKVETTESTSTTKTTTTTKKKTTKKIVKKIQVKETEITNYLYERILQEGWNTTDYNAIVNIIIKESGFNPNSVNKTSGACGLFQAHPCNKAIKQYPDYMTNYKSQIDWGIKYIKGRYGTPTKAWNFWQVHKWY